MKKFSYGLEFYKNNIFDLDNTKLFEYKVKEAEEIERYFSQVIYNVDFIRKYIIRSYYFNKSARFHRRIAYIKGLILGENYVDFEDLIEFSDYISENLTVEPKTSLWKYKGYFDDPKSEDVFEGTTKENEYRAFTLVSSKSVDYEDSGEDEENEEDEEDEKEEDKKKVVKFIESDLVPLHPKEKLIQFKKLKKRFINEMIENKNIHEEEMQMVKKGMTDWINYILNSMEDAYKINEHTLRYNDENISKYL